MNSFRKLWLRASVSGLALASGLAMANAASAQNGAQTQTTAKSNTQGADVVITAERRVINLQVAPVAAVVLTGKQLQARSVYSVDDLQFISPSLTITNYGLGEDFNIRGIGKSETNVQTPSGIVTYRDGVATFAGFFTQEPYLDLANIEVLRGPQGTFAGANASGGAVFITENDPNFSGDHGMIEAQYGAYNDVRLRGVLNMPISDTFAIRLATHAEMQDSFYSLHGPYTGNPGRLQDFVGRISLLWQPTANFRATLKNDYVYYDTGGMVGSPVPIPPGAPPYPTYASNANLFNVGDNVHGLYTSWWNRTVLNMAYTFSDGIVVKSITGYQTGRIGADNSLNGTAQLPASFFSVIANESLWSQEVDVISPSQGPFRWVAGGYLQWDDVKIPFSKPGFDISAGGLDILLKYHTPKDTQAVFGQVSYDITPALEIVGGARFTHSTFTLTDTTALFLTTPFIPLASENAHGVQNDDKVTGKVSLNWTIDPTNFVYAFVATGHKPGGINTTPFPFGSGAPVVPFQPEDLTDYEIGWKPTWYDGHVRGQFGAFYTTYQHFQLSYADPNVAGGNSIIQNVPGTTVIYGLEGQLQAAFGPWSFDVTAAYLHTELGSSAKKLGNPFGVPENISGNQQPYAPQFTFNAGAQYVFHLGDGSRLTPRVDYAFVDDQWASPFQGNDGSVPAGTRQLERYVFHLRPINLVNAQLTWDNGPVEVTLYGTNIFNMQYFYLSGTPGLRQAAPPAQVGIRASRSF